MAGRRSYKAGNP